MSCTKIRARQDMNWLKKTKKWNSVNNIIEVESMRILGTKKTQMSIEYHINKILNNT